LAQAKVSTISMANAIWPQAAESATNRSIFLSWESKTTDPDGRSNTHVLPLARLPQRNKDPAVSQRETRPRSSPTSRQTRAACSTSHVSKPG
jgi:hypothetical protein